MNFQPPRPKNDDERILPLINVVFLLLIFFILAGRLTAADPFPVMPPSSATEGDVEANPVTVLVGPDGTLALDGQPMEEEAVFAGVRQRLQDEPEAPVRLKADGAAAATMIVRIMEKLREAGVERLRLLTVSAGA